MLKPGKPHAGNPEVVILHARMGLSEHEKQSAEQLANLGYFALAADLFGTNSVPKTVENAVNLTGFLKVTEIFTGIESAQQLTN